MKDSKPRKDLRISFIIWKRSNRYKKNWIRLWSHSVHLIAKEFNHASWRKFITSANFCVTNQQKQIWLSLDFRQKQAKEMTNLNQGLGLIHRENSSQNRRLSILLKVNAIIFVFLKEFPMENIAFWEKILKLDH